MRDKKVNYGTGAVATALDNGNVQGRDLKALISLLALS